MSEDLRIKKLRGSGGFVIAQVTDEQQRKGNLGGPDLFLAPIGRLDVESVKKYTCNTCDKEYEGSPKIEYENPNEEVAENLILVERGQYICTTCGSSIAEYREFQKPNESVEVGNANPIEAQTEIGQEVMNEAQQESDDQYHTFDDFRETVPEISTEDSTFNARGNILNGSGEGNPNTRADMVYYKTPNDGAVISFSSMSWLGSLSHNNYENNVSRLMKNVIDGFMKDGPLP